VCTFWGIASGLVGAVVVLMGVIAFNPMLKAGYDVKLAAGVITAGGTLGILIPPSVMIIVYAAVAGQSVVKLYAAAMFPGFFLASISSIIGWALNPRRAEASGETRPIGHGSPNCSGLFGRMPPAFWSRLSPARPGIRVDARATACC
jgi:TRAP-type mannitol/chloroaromatic compound transport system permease large subunit